MTAKCKLCGRSIKDPKSIARGIGASCWAKTHGKRKRTSKGKAKKRRRRVKVAAEWKQDEFLFETKEVGHEPESENQP